VPRLRPTVTLHRRRPVAFAVAFALAATLSALLAVSASASSREVTKITEECAAGTLPSGFSQQAYTQATKELEPYLAEYSDCPDLIRKAQLTGAAHGGAGGGGAGGEGATSTAAVAPATPTEQHALESIPHAAAPSVAVGDQVVHPGVVHVDLASAFSTLPTPLLALLSFLLACALLLAGRAVLQRARRADGGASRD
jgi:hypothetical protein